MIRIRPMTVADLPLGLRLSDEAGWNQVPADWQRFLDLQPDGCFVAEYDGAAVGTTTTCIFGSVAWIAMVLVAETARGRGVGTALMEHALGFLDDRGIATVRLDARPMAQPLYERLGFVEQYRIAHYEGTLPVAPSVGGESAALAGGRSTRQQMLPIRLPRMGRQEALAGGRSTWELMLVVCITEALMDLDERFTRMDRRRLLRRLFSEHPAWWVAQKGLHYGYWTARPGKRTIRLGPCIATASAGPALLADAWHRYAGHLVSLDVPAANETAMQWVQSHGLTVQHTLTRMCRGTPVVEQVEFLWASSGPEKG